MDVLQSRKALSSAGLALGFSLLVAWMVPPTKPRPASPDWRANFKPVAPPAPVDFAGFAPATATMAAYPVERYAGGDVDVAIHRSPANPEETASSDPPDDHADFAWSATTVPAAHDREGSGWAGAAGVSAPRDCRDDQNGCSANSDSLPGREMQPEDLAGTDADQPEN